MLLVKTQTIIHLYFCINFVIKVEFFFYLVAIISFLIIFTDEQMNNA